MSYLEIPLVSPPQTLLVNTTMPIPQSRRSCLVSGIHASTSVALLAALRIAVLEPLSRGLGALNSWHVGCLVLMTAAACDVPPSHAEPLGTAKSPDVLAARPISTTEARPPSASNCPEGMVQVKTYCIDRYEAHLVLASEPHALHPPYQRPRSGVRYQAEAAPGIAPQGYISQREAAVACKNAGKRLCSASEWQQACKGSRGNQYPYGESEEKGRCNTGKAHVPTRLFGALALRNTDAYFNNPRLNQEPGFLAKSGEYSECVGEYGVFDMVGNLHEWVADSVGPKLPKSIPIPYGAHNMGRPGNGVFLGGYFSSRSEHGHGCEYVTTHHSQDYHDYSTGFRCCADLNNSGGQE